MSLLGFYLFKSYEICLDYGSILNRNGYRALDDSNAFVAATLNHAKMVREWKRDIETKRDKARNYLISSDNIVEIQDDEMQIEPVTAQIPTSPLKGQHSTVLPVSTIETVLLPSKADIIVKFTLNKQQTFAFKIICDHLDGDHSSRNGKFLTNFDNMLPSTIYQIP